MAGVLTTVAAAASCPATNFDQYLATSGDWSTSANWSLSAPPSGTQVACWNAGTTVTVSTAVSVDSIQAGGDLSIVAGGTLTLTSTANDSAVGDLFLEGGGELDGPVARTMTVAANFDWGGSGSGTANLNGAAGSGLAIASGPLTVDGSTSTPQLLGGSVNTGSSSVSITNGGFQASGGAALTTTSTITLGSAVKVGGSGASFTAAGVGATGGSPQTYGFGTDALTLTGGTTTVASGNTFDTGPLALQGGTLVDDGTVASSPSAVTLSGGTLRGTGAVDGAVALNSGTISPGDAAPGTLTVVGNYSQTGGTLDITLASGAFGQLAVQGTAALGGTLSLTDASGFTPGQAASFQILTSTGTRSGTFATVAGPNAGTYYPQYGAGGVTLLVTPAGCPAGNFDAYAASGGNWSTAANWSQSAPPSGTQVACWTAGTTVTVSDSESADSIQAGGNLTIVSGGTLKLTASTHGSSVNALALEVGGELDGPASPSAQTLTVTGNFDWGGGTGSGTAALNAAANSNLTVNQTADGTGALTIDGTGSTPALDGGSVITNSPASITNSNFRGVSGAVLTVTGQPLTLGSGVSLTTGTGGTIVAAGIDTVGGANTVQSFAVHLTTGATSSLASGSTLNVQSLTTDAGTTLPVPSGVALNVFAGTISGTINGAGTFTATGGTVEIKAGGALSTSSVSLPTGTLTVDSGATYNPATATTITGGVLNVNANSSTGALSLEAGQLNGASGITLTVTGAFDWGASATGSSAGAINSATGAALAISQTGGASFAIDSHAGSTPQLAGGLVTTTSPVSITSPAFATTHTPALTTSSTITLGASVAISGTGASFTAAGVNPTGGSPQNYGFGGNGLTLTGGTTTVAVGNTLTAGALKLTGGTLQDDGTVAPTATTLTGGTLQGIGKVNGAVTNSSGTVAPGDGAAGILTITGNYVQSSAATLAVQIDGTTAGTGTGFFGQLKVSGTANVSGTLAVTDVAGFTPAQANTFAILTATSRTGEFTQLSGNAASIYFAQYGATNVTLAVTSSSCPATGFDAYSPSGGSWSTAANWSTGAAPTGTQVACWSSGVTVTVSNAQTVNSIQAAGNLTIASGGTLTLGSGTATTTSTVGALTLAGGGELDAPSDLTHAQTLDVTGAFSWAVGTGTTTASINKAAGSSLQVIQPSGQTMTIGASTQTASLGGGSILTGSPVSIAGSHFQGVAGTTLTTTQAVTLGSATTAVNLATGAGTIVAGAINTLDPGATNSITGFALHLTTGTSSSLAANSTLQVQNLTTDSGTTLPVPAGAALNVFSGTLSGTVSGAGTFVAGIGATGGTTEIKGGGALSTAVTVGPGSVIVDTGASYGAASTTVGAGSLTLNAASSTGALSVTGGGQVNGVSGNSLTASGAVTWTSGALTNLALTQTGTGFSVSGAGTTSLAGGSVNTPSPVSITSTHFQTSGTPTLTTSSTITLGPSVAITSSGATFVAAGLGPASGTGAGVITTTYDFGAGEALTLTGGSTTVASSGLLETGALTLTAGTLQDDGTIEPSSTTVTGGALQGQGTITNALNNSAGTVAPGDGGPGVLNIGGNYSQGGAGTLAITLGGTTAGSGFSQLQVGGTAALSGNLSLSDVGGFTPSGSDTFQILSSTSARSGAMTVTGPSADLYVVRYNPNDVTLASSPTPANIEAPTITGAASVGQSLTCSDGTWSASPTTFTFQWNRDGTPIAGAMSQSYVVSTADRGASLTCTVTASNSFGQGTPATSAAVSIPAPVGTPSSPLDVVSPIISGTPTPGNHLTCSNGVWLPSPSGFTYQWARNGVPIAGATSSVYTVQIGDEGASLTCTVSGSNGGGTGVSSPSAAIVVAEPGTLTCAKPTGKLSGRSLGPLQLGFKRTRARHTLSRYTAVGAAEDDYCLYGGWGIHAGYPTNALLRSVAAAQRGRFKGRIALALTSNPYYALGAARPGMTLSSVARRLGTAKAVTIGANSWYVLRGSVSRGVLKVRGGIIQEIGIATVAFTNTRAAQRRLLNTFTGA
ncbi:MAG TPA: hypothetical protein VG295_10220 [Solirubrobacteraceae bacterium]|nr:hypothetical protein [Solirubrobacteraceae bacterium]